VKKNFSRLHRFISILFILSYFCSTAQVVDVSSFRAANERKVSEYISNIRLNLANTYNAYVLADSAIMLAKHDLQECRSKNEHACMVRSYISLAELLKVKRIYYFSVAYIDSAIALASADTLLAELRDAYKEKSDIYLFVNNYQVGMKYYVESVKINDSLSGILQENSIRLVREHYTDEIDSLNRILTKTGTDRSKADIDRFESFKSNALIGGVILIALIIVLCLWYVRRHREPVIVPVDLKDEVIINEKPVIAKTVVDDKKVITDNTVEYVKRIQDAVLPSDEQVKKLFPESFVFYKPKEALCGDFYWFAEAHGKKFFTAADCTGRGTQGAILSLIGIKMLDAAVKQFSSPSLILDNLNKEITTIFSRTYDACVRDGMDMALCAIDPVKMRLEFSGANNSVWIIRKKEVLELKGSKVHVGNYISTDPVSYGTRTFPLLPGDVIYVGSDGYEDQFGGEKGKKFMVKALKELLVSIADKPMDEQKNILEQTFESHRGGHEQIDDVCIVAVKI
jgi:hypothetical protein